MHELDFVKATIQIERDAFMAARVAEFMADGLTNEEAAQEAADEWAPALRAKAPNCWDCEFIGPIQRDPYGTGDSPDFRECNLFNCPWEKR